MVSLVARIREGLQDTLHLGNLDSEKRGWTAKVSLTDLIAEMVAADLRLAQRDALVAKKGYKVFTHHE
jgi:GDPmannose 4,6-dehydratase